MLQRRLRARHQEILSKLDQNKLQKMEERRNAFFESERQRHEHKTEVKIGSSASLFPTTRVNMPRPQRSATQETGIPEAKTPTNEEPKVNFFAAVWFRQQRISAMEKRETPKSMTATDTTPEGDFHTAPQSPTSDNPESYSQSTANNDDDYRDKEYNYPGSPSYHPTTRGNQP